MPGLPKCPKGKGRNAGKELATARRKGAMVKGSSKTGKSGGKTGGKSSKYGL